MKQQLKILGIIPARGGSKGIPKKNIVKLNRKPLISYTISEAKKSKYLSKIVVSTDDSEIFKISKKLNVDVIKRPKKLSGDTTPTFSVLLHVLQKIEKSHDFSPDILVVLQPTSPLRIATDIDKTISKFLKTSCNSAVSVSLVSHPLAWIYKQTKNEKITPLFPSSKILRRQDSPILYQLNGAVYVISKNYFLKHKTLLGKKLVSYVMPPERSIDIDTYFDLMMAEVILKHKS